MEEEIFTVDLKDIFNQIKNHMVEIIAVTLSCAIIGFCVTNYLIDKKYEASATMIVNTRQDQNVTVTNDQLNSAKQLVTTYSVILKSDTVIDKVIDNLNLRNIEGWEDVTAEEFAKNYIRVEQVDNTQVMKITAKTTDADLSADIVSEIVKLAPDMIINTVKAGSVEVISAPKANYQKVSPSLGKNTALCGLLGMFASTGAVILIGILDNTFKSDEDIIKHLGLTVIGVIPMTKEKEEK